MKKNPDIISRKFLNFHLTSCFLEITKNTCFLEITRISVIFLKKMKKIQKQNDSKELGVCRNHFFDTEPEPKPKPKKKTETETETKPKPKPTF